MMLTALRGMGEYSASSLLGILLSRKRQGQDKEVFNSCSLEQCLLLARMDRENGTVGRLRASSMADF